MRAPDAIYAIESISIIDDIKCFKAAKNVVENNLKNS